MASWRICVSKIRGFFSLGRANREFEDELQEHLRMLEQRFVAQGMAPADAAAAAQRQFGNKGLLQQRQNEMRTVLSLAKMVRDVRFGIRQMLRNPLFSAIAVFSVALGIGANTAVFTLLDQLVLRLLPVKDPQQLVMIWTTGPHMGGSNGAQTASYPMYRDFQHWATAFNYVFCRFDTTVAVGLGSEGAEQATAELVSGNFFQALDVRPELGRLFAPATDDRIYEGHPSVVLSHLYWVNRFGGDPNIIGQKILVNDHWMEVVGVSAGGFSGLDPSRSPDMWVPILMEPLITSGRDDITNRRSQWVQIFARLKPGYSAVSAQASLQPLLHNILVQEVNEPALSHLSAFDRARFLERKAIVETAASGYSDLRRTYATALKVLMGMAVLTLLIVCSNVANLLLSRASARQQEIAVRLAIGASPRALVMQLLVESMLLSFCGALLGLGLAVVATRSLLHMLPRNGAMSMLHATPDWRVLVFSLVITLATGFLFGLAPALQGTNFAARAGLNERLTNMGRGSTARTRKAFVVVQVALSFVLLAGAGLFTRTLMNLKDTRTGFAHPDSLVEFQVDPSRSGYNLPRIRALYSSVLREIESVPEIKSAAYAMWPLLNGARWDLTVAVERHPAAPGENMQTFYNVVSPGFFKTVGVPLVQGRDFIDTDQFEGNDRTMVPTVAIVNRAFAERFFGGKNPVGLHIGCCRGTATMPDIQIVGLVENSIVGDLRQPMESEVFFPYLQSTQPQSVAFYVRSNMASNATFRSAQSIFARHDRSVALFGMTTLAGQMDETLSTERLIAALSVVFGMLAAALAAVGLYGVIAYSVGRRTKEIAVRMALGASRKSVLLLVMREVLVMLVTGLTAGIFAAILLSRLIRAELFGVDATDTWIYLAVVAVLGMVTFGASSVPALRATRTNPLTSLRCE